MCFLSYFFSTPSKIPVFSYLNPKQPPHPKSIPPKPTPTDKQRFKGEALPLPAAEPTVSKPEQRKFFGFLNKPRDPKKDKKPQNKKLSNKDKDAKAYKKKKPVVNENTALQTDDSKNSSHPPFVPTKRIIQHHEYQNLLEEAAAIKNAAKLIEKMPALRRFGDTNIIKNRRENQQKPQEQRTPKRTSNKGHAPSPPSHHTSSTISHSDQSFLSSLDPSDSYCASKFFNIALKPPAPPSKSSSSFIYKYSAAASSSSNLSAGSTISDSNSLDSMEHEIVHRKPVAPRGGADQSYLGPFNFRQLLRPTQGPTESLRKRRGINLSSTPPPLQKGKA